jgi:hypothetical protein
LPVTNHIHCFNTPERASGTVEKLETKHRVIQIFHLPQFNLDCQREWAIISLMRTKHLKLIQLDGVPIDLEQDADDRPTTVENKTTANFNLWGSIPRCSAA